jgi:ABC-2 type transport system permease protein
MNRFWGFVLKEFYHIFRDKRSLIILLGMPIAQILIFGYVLNNEIRNVPIAVLDLSHDPLSRKAVDKIVSSGYFTLESYLTNENEIEAAFKRGKIKEVIVFEADFAKKYIAEKKANVQVIADASDANTANLVVNYTMGIFQKLNIEVSPLQIRPAGIEVKTRMVFNENLQSSFMFIPGTIALLLMLISAMMTSISFTREKEMGTMQVLLVSPLKPFQIVAGKMMPYIGLSFLIGLIILVLGTTMFGVPIRGSLGLLLTESLLFTILSLSLGLLISIKAASQQVAMMISMFGLMLPTMLLSGFVFPIENMPVWLQAICNIIPAKWFIIVLKNIMLHGSSLAYIWKETLILILMTAFLLFLSVKNFKVRLE